MPLENITFTSDACGSLPGFDENGNLIKLEMGLPKSMLTELTDTVLEEKMPLEQALKVLTSNVADILKLKQKGRIALGKDADVLLFNDAFDIIYMTAMGELFVSEGKALRKGSYER